MTYGNPYFLVNDVVAACAGHVENPVFTNNGGLHL